MLELSKPQSGVGGWVVGLGIFSCSLTGVPMAIAQPPTPGFSDTGHPPHPPILLAQRLECRQIAPERGAPFYSSLPQYRRTPSDFLPRGSRVSVDVTAGSIQAPDGQFYQFVTYPFGSSNTVTGYIPVQTQTQNGIRNTLEQCRRRMW